MADLAYYLMYNNSFVVSPLSNYSPIVLFTTLCKHVTVDEGINGSYLDDLWTYIAAPIHVNVYKTEGKKLNSGTGRRWQPTEISSESNDFWFIC